MGPKRHVLALILPLKSFQELSRYAKRQLPTIFNLLIHLRRNYYICKFNDSLLFVLDSEQAVRVARVKRACRLRNTGKVYIKMITQSALPWISNDEKRIIVESIAEINFTEFGLQFTEKIILKNCGTLLNICRYMCVKMTAGRACR